MNLSCELAYFHHRLVRTISFQAYITIAGVSLATGYFAGHYISAVQGPIPSRDEAKPTEPEGDNSESDASSETGDGDLAQVNPSLDEECKLVGFQHPRFPLLDV
jgi:hypothetical protein